MSRCRCCTKFVNFQQCRTAIRPAGPQTLKKETSGSSSSKRGPILIAIVLGSLALGSYIAKPPSHQPMATIDLFKPKIAIVFLLGKPDNKNEKVAREFGYCFLPASTEIAQIEKLVSAGRTKFMIYDMKPENMSDFEERVFECDLAIDYAKSRGKEEKQQLERYERSMRLCHGDKPLQDLLRERNLI